MYKIYSKDNCNWCVKTKQLMNETGLNYQELKLGTDYGKEELRNLLPANLPLTVPQIFVYNKRIGGYEDFQEYLENTGVLGIKQ
jgi:glutaredoxin